MVPSVTTPTRLLVATKMPLPPTTLMPLLAHGAMPLLPTSAAPVGTKPLLLLRDPAGVPATAPTVRLPPTATTLLPVPTRMLVLKATETLDNALMLHGTEMVPRTPTSASAPLLTSLLRTTLATTDMPSLLLTPTHTVPSPLRPTVMPLSRTVPVATNSEELLLPLPTRPDTRRTS